MEKLPIYEITFDPTMSGSGIDYISIVEEPAIMVKGMYFSENKKFVFNKDQQIIVGPALIPDIPIYRFDENLGEYYVVFRKETIKAMVEKFNKENSNKKINVDHSNKMVDAFVVEDWIVEDETYDKSRKYGFNVPIGTYMIIVKIEDKEFWELEVKEKEKYGFSIEGMMGLSFSKIEFESYNDYPQAASDNACKVIRWKEEHPDEIQGMTQVGWIRANQLCGRENISEETIARMASFARHRRNAEVSEENSSTPWKDAGYVAWLGWGGDEGIAWAQRKLEEIRTELSINNKNQIKMKTNKSNNKFQKNKKFVGAIKTQFQEEGKAVIVSEDEVVLVTEALEVGRAATVIMDDLTPVYEYDGEIYIDDRIVVLQTGVITEIKTEEEETTEEITEEVAVEAEVVSVEETDPSLRVNAEDIMAVVSPMMDELRAIVAELSNRVDMLENKEEVIEEEMGSQKFSVSTFERLMDLKRMLNK